jgi:hypothetical protein
VTLLYDLSTKPDCQMSFSYTVRSSHTLLTFRKERKFFIAITRFAVNTSRLSDGIVPAP